MKKLSIRVKITLWFSIALVLFVILTYTAVLSVSYQVIQKTIRDGLIETVEGNVDEVEYLPTLENINFDSDADQFIRYGDGFLKIEDDFLDRVNGIRTGLYQSDSALLYGENPITASASGIDFADSRIQRITVSGTLYYIFDRRLDGDGLDGLWLRGIVSERQGDVQLHAISKLSLLALPILVLLAIVGGYLIAGRMLRPIHQITVTASQISQGGDLKKRIELDDGQDELHQLADSFNKMFLRLDQSFESEKQFTSDVSHELRTPVSVILAQCEYTLQNPCTSEEYVDSLQVIERQGKKMSVLINDLLSFTRLEMRPEMFEKTPVNFSELTVSVAEDMALIRENNITLSHDVEPDVIFPANPELLTRLLTNLIGNAYRYGRENGHTEVCLRRTEEGVLLSVSDDGRGIPEDELESIFRRFYQSDSSRTGEGTGLGLSMVQEIAHFHGGKAWAESALGEGSTFFVSFPYHNSDLKTCLICH